MTAGWRVLLQDSGRLRVVLSFFGIGLAVVAIVLDRTWLTWTAIAVLGLAVAMRLAARRRAKMAASREEPDDRP